jgi:hypothetical protein
MDKKPYTFPETSQGLTVTEFVMIGVPDNSKKVTGKLIKRKRISDLVVLREKYNTIRLRRMAV